VLAARAAGAMDPFTQGLDEESSARLRGWASVRAELPTAGPGNGSPAACAAARPRRA